MKTKENLSLCWLLLSVFIFLAALIIAGEAVSTENENIFLNLFAAAELNAIVSIVIFWICNRKTSQS